MKSAALPTLVSSLSKPTSNRPPAAARQPHSALTNPPKTQTASSSRPSLPKPGESAQELKPSLRPFLTATTAHPELAGSESALRNIGGLVDTNARREQAGWHWKCRDRKVSRTWRGDLSGAEAAIKELGVLLQMLSSGTRAIHRPLRACESGMRCDYAVVRKSRGRLGEEAMTTAIRRATMAI